MVSGGSTVIELLGVFDRATASLEFAQVVSGALDFLHHSLGVERASVALVREGGQPGFLLYDTNLPLVGVESGALLPPNAATLAETVREQKSTYRKDLRTRPVANPVDEKLLAAGLLCTLSVPLVSGGRCLGTLNAAVRDVDGLDEEVRSLLEVLAPRLARAIAIGLAVEALARSERQFRTVFERVSDGIVVAERATRKFLLVNQAMADLLGRPPEDVLRLGVGDIHPASSLSAVVETFTAMASGALTSAGDVPVQRADGTVFLADVSASSLEMGGRQCVVGVFRDGSERRRREQELLLKQKMESIRLLAAGIAHDFNNVLTGVQGNLTAAKEVVGAGSEAAGLLGEAERACSQAARLTRQLLTFAKGGAPVRKVLDLRGLVGDAMGLAAAGADVRYELEADPATWPVFADEGQLVQAVQNLVLNAVQASPSGALVRVSLGNGAGGEAPNGAQEYVCLRVQDWGCGMSEEALSKAFLPFFTTKPGRSGLGLAAAHSIVTNHGGRLEVESSRVGQGTVFRMLLPARHAEVAPQRPHAPKAAVGSGRVLVMDDEAMVRQVTRAALTRAGYEVVCVEHGQAAIDAWAAAGAEGRPFDVVVLDLTVRGGMGGLETSRRILEASPSARLLVSSGYCDDPVMSDPAGHGFAGMLAKPYSVRDLCAAVAAAKASERPPAPVGEGPSGPASRSADGA